MQRRNFLQAAAAGAPAAGNKIVGIQIGAVSFMDEGVEKALDMVQQAGKVNTLFLATFPYGRGSDGCRAGVAWRRRRGRRVGRPARRGLLDA